MDLTLKPDSERYGDEFEPDLTSLPGWSEANVLMRDRIVQAALKYVSSLDPEISQWLGTNIIHRPALAGYKAFWLLLKERPHIFSSISHDTWIKWAPVIIAYPSQLRNISSKDMRKELIAEAYRHAPKSLIDALIILIDKDNSDLGRIFIVRDVNDIWDERFHEALLSKVKDEKLKLESTSDLLDFLLAHDSNEARKYAESLFLSLYPEETTGQKAIIIGGLLLAYPSDSSWMIIWPVIENNREIGKDIIFNAGRKSYGQSEIIEKSLKEAYLAKLFIWLYRNFPPSEYSLPLGGFTDTPRYQIAEFRDSIIRHLKERGTLAAVEAMAEIAREFPQEDWLKWMIPEAQEILLRQSWIPYSQIYVRDFIINYEKTLSLTGDKNKERRDEIIDRLKSIEFGVSRLSLSSGNARQNLVELQAELELIKDDIKSKDKSVEELRADLGDISSPIIEELERTKSALIVALEEHTKSHQDLNDLVSVQGAAVQRLKQSNAREILGLTADVTSLIGLAFSILSTLKP